MNLRIIAIFILDNYTCGDIYYTHWVQLRIMVSEQALVQFKQIYYTKYHIDLTNQEAMKQALEFLNLMRVVLKPQKLTHEKENTR